MISKESKAFLAAGVQLQENFGRLVTINHLLNEAKIDMSQLETRLVRYNKYFDVMLEKSPKDQDWDFIIHQLEDNKKEIEIYLSWIKDIEKYNIQVTEREVLQIINYQNLIGSQLKKLEAINKE